MLRRDRSWLFVEGRSIFRGATLWSLGSTLGGAMRRRGSSDLRHQLFGATIESGGDICPAQCGRRYRTNSIFRVGRSGPPALCTPKARGCCALEARLDCVLQRPLVGRMWANLQTDNGKPPNPQRVLLKRQRDISPLMYRRSNRLSKPTPRRRKARRRAASRCEGRHPAIPNVCS